MPEVIGDIGSVAAIGAGCLSQPSSVVERPFHWYPIYTSPRHEKRVSQHLQERSVDHFLPIYRTVHGWKNGCKVQVELPLFPGYLFVKIDRAERIRVLEVPGVLFFVGARSEPAALPDFEIETLRSGLHLQKFEPYPHLAVGQRVRIRSGPLAGLAGVLVRNTNYLRVVLTVDLIHQSVAVEVDAENVEPLKC